MKNSILLIGILFLSHSISSTEYSWGSKYKISLRQVSNFVSELKIIDAKTNNVIHDSLTGMKHVLRTKRKKISENDVFFIQATTGGEGFVSSNLYYFYFESGELKQGVIEDIIEFSLRNLDRDKDREIILTDFKYYKFNVNRCLNSKEPDPHYSGTLLPTIYKFRQGKFFKEKNDSEFLKRYKFKLERKLLKKKKFNNLKGYSHYYAISKKLGLEKSALNYFKENNSNFTYRCENTSYPKGKSFSLNTNYYDFFQKFGKDIYR